MQRTSGAVTDNINDEPPSVLNIGLLGAFELRAPYGHTLDLGSRKAQALLAYLAMTDRPIPRNTLTSLLWPEMPEQRAKNNLRTMLSVLKQQLAPYLNISTMALAFNRHQPYFLDVEAFLARVNSAIASRNLAELQTAVALYKGEFLEGFHLRNAAPFEEWLLQQREHLHIRMLAVFETLVTVCVERGEYSLGVAAAHNLLSREPWSEVVHQQLMILLAKSGQRAAALAQYERCRRILADELGVEPALETTALYQQIQAETFDQTQPDNAPTLALSTTVAPDHRATLSKTFPVLPNNLITPLARFIGRGAELTFLTTRLMAAECRLLTITGPGGVGKTALALALGRRLLDLPKIIFPDGIFFVSLAAINGSTEGDSAATTQAIMAKIAGSIGCEFQDGHPRQAQLQAYLRPRRLLLILDNFEQLADHSDLIVTLLTNAADLTMLITSRVRLNIRGESVLELQGLSLPAHGDVAPPQLSIAWQKSEAITLFAERARGFDAQFMLNAETLAPIAEICQSVGGLPLAIEMLAGWLPFYSCAEIAATLKQGEIGAEWLRSRFRDQPKRHETLQRVFADSWDLLPAAAQAILAQLTIFVGSFTRGAAQAVTGAALPDLIRLQEHSLLQIDREGACSLHPLIKQFAALKWQQLTEREPQRRHLLQQAHSRYYLQQVANLMDTLRGKEAVAAIHSFRNHHADIVRGWQWTVQTEDGPQIQYSMYGFFRYLELTNQGLEGAKLFGQAADQQSGPIAQWLQVARCHFWRRLAEHDQARARLEALLATLSPWFVSQNGAPPLELPAYVATTNVFALCELGWVYYEQGSYAAAQRCFADAHMQAQRLAEPTDLPQMLNGLGAVAFSTKRYEEAREHYQAALTHAQQRADLHYTAIVLGNLAALAQTTQAYAQAENYLQMRLQIDEQTQNERQMAVSYQRLGQLALISNSYAGAEAHFRRSLAHFEQLGNSPEIAHVVLDLSKSLLRQSLLQEAERQCLRGLHLALQAQITPRILAALTLLAEIRLAADEKDEAVTLLQMVNRYGEIPVATLNRAQQLQARLAEELGAEMMMSIHQKTVGQSLQEFSLVVLQGRDSVINRSFARLTT
ncbi:MAG: BTAD domain-containing putative transcriptional regulator [Caldilineaceae bacterium]